ncbi:hypothetical protein NKG95_32180 [Mesorhizobium sp. M1423]
MSLPFGAHSTGGLPIGLQIVGRFGDPCPYRTRPGGSHAVE